MPSGGAPGTARRSRPGDTADGILVSRVTGPVGSPFPEGTVRILSTRYNLGSSEGRGGVGSGRTGVLVNTDASGHYCACRVPEDTPSPRSLTKRRYTVPLRPIRSSVHSWRTVPGRDRDGRIDGARLQGWLGDTELRLRQAERVAIGHQKIGQMLSGSPHDPDGTWPCRPVRDAIEKVASKDLEIGLGTGVMNSPGVVSKNPSEGGAPERALAERYEGYAAAVRALHPCTAGALRRIAQWYRRDGSREDFRVEMWEEL